MKKIILPLYSKFSCIAEKCPLNCCQFYRIGFFRWEADKFDTNPLWKDIDGKGNSIRHYLKKDDYGWAFTKAENGDCIFLKERLCSIQRRIGPEAMPCICRTFPRVISKLNGRLEYSLDPCCPVVSYLAKDWDLDFELSGDGDFEKDEKFLKREKILKLLTDKKVALKECFAAMAEEYGTGLEIPDFSLTGAREEYIRKTTILMIWCFIIAYDNYPTIPNMAAYIITLMLQTIEKFEKEGTSEDWWEMSVSFTELFIKSIIELEFDRDDENTYVDVLD